MNETALDEIETSASYDLVVIGGGLAGIAAALEFRKLHPDSRIALFESRKRLGGRAGSFVDPKTGAWVDNCQHVGLGCCDELLHFVDSLGAADAFRRVRTLRFRTPDGRTSAISAVPILPAPLHLGLSFARLHFLSLWDKSTLGFGMMKLAATPPARLKGRSVADWLRANFQTRRSIARFWEPVLVSALNDSLDRLDVSGARQVFVESFFKRRDGFHLLIPAVPLGELFDTRARKTLENGRIEVFDNRACRRIEPLAAGFRLHFRDESAVVARNVILAVPWAACAELMRSTGRPGLQATIERADSLQPSPITGVHLILDRKVCDESEVALLDTTAQWAFDHSDADRSQPNANLPADGQSLHVVVSASRCLTEMKREAILDLIVGELQASFPRMKGARILSSWVVTEHAATFGPAPGTDAIRPENTTALPGLYLAGDWTATGWPATMEGAIRSGLNAARVAKDGFLA